MSTPPDRVAPPHWRPTAADDPRPWVIYDGRCRVCRRFAEALRRFDRRDGLVVVPSHDPEVVRQLGWIPEAAFAEGLQFVAADGRNWQGAAAVERIISDLASDAWAWGALEGALRLPGARPLLRLGYDTFARHRCRLGCG